LRLEGFASGRPFSSAATISTIAASSRLAAARAHLDGCDIVSLPLIERKAMLEPLVVKI
jgi:hypothetical protein